jgi:prevent-host-death family protein
MIDWSDQSCYNDYIMLHYTMTEGKAHFSELVAAAAAGEEIIITKMGKEMARLVPPKKKKAFKRTGFLKGKLFIAEDFDDLPDDIARAFGMID